MKADLLKRIVRAIADGSEVDLRRLARKIVEAERKSGHVRLAHDIEAILDKAAERTPRPISTPAQRELKELPLSRRHGEALATFIARESLEHHMVLPSHIEDRLSRIEREYAARERLGVFGLRPRKTILLYGPPGCGKTLGAKRLAWNTGLPVLKVRFDALISSYFGESANNLRRIFESASGRPCLLLLDECDFIAKSRINSKDIGEASRIVNTLLQLMEEYSAPGLLVATTNVEDALDPALFRRFDEVLHIPPPGAHEIESLLRTTLSSIEVAPSVDWKAVTASLVGCSAASVVKAAQDAAKAAVLGGRKRVGEADLKLAVDELKRKSAES